MKASRATNWQRGGVVKKEKRPYLMGEGLGNCLGLDGPKYTRDHATLMAIAEEDAVYFEELREVRKAIRKKEAAYRKSLKELLARKAAEGEVLVDQRIFYTEWYHRDWERRAEQVGGVPTGVDIARSPYALLLMIPVLEVDTAKQRGIVIERIAQRRDSYGRPFWVLAELKQTLVYIFGSIRWNRPISLVEAGQFGVKVI